MTKPETGVTKILAEWVCNSSYDSIPENVCKEGVRTLLNWIGCAVGASRHEAVEITLRSLKPFMGVCRSSLLGRVEKVDALNAALINGISSHVLDFDDTHLKTIIHPAGPVASAIVALSEHTAVSGKELLHALILGVEVECRIGNAVYPNHYDAGWHITGTAGVFGAAAACGHILRLNSQQMCWALGTAATQAAGLREMFGSMCKPLHIGRAAQNGLSSALLAAEGFTSSEQSIEAPRGFANVLATKCDYSKIVEDLGVSFEILSNTYKPFPCGIVIHPTIDACIQLYEEHRFNINDVCSIELEVNPLVLELTGKKRPNTGLEAKFSVYHSAAVALIRGQVLIEDYSDLTVTDPSIVSLRNRITAIPNHDVHEAKAIIRARMRDGQMIKKVVEFAQGSLELPLSDNALEQKVHKLSDPILNNPRVNRMIHVCRTLRDLDEARYLPLAATPCRKNASS